MSPHVHQTATPAPAPAAEPMPSAPVLGVPLALTDYERTLDWIDQAVAARHQGYLCVATTHTVMATRDDPSLRAAVLGAEFTVPDGQPLVWALKALGHDVRMQRAGLEWLLDRR